MLFFRDLLVLLDPLDFLDLQDLWVSQVVEDNLVFLVVPALL